MQIRSAQVQLTVMLPAHDYRNYATAVRKLRRLIGSSAPDIAALVQHELGNRAASMIVDDYLESHARRRSPARSGSGRLSCPPEQQ